MRAAYGAKRAVPAIHLALLCANAALYHAVAAYPFLHDDHPYILENPMVREGLSWSGLKWAWTTAPGMPWHPLTWISHMADCQWFGLAPGPHHLVNLALHAANTSLCFELLRRMAGGFGQGALAAALFALHPLAVEPVAWVAGRKDLLAAGLAFGAMLAFRGFARKREPRRYAAALLLFALGLLAKPVLSGLPLLLFALDRRSGTGGESWRARWGEKAPFFLLSAAAGVAALRSIPPALTPASVTARDWFTQAAATARMILTSLGRFLWPHDLAVAYAVPEPPDPAAAAALLLAFAACVAAAAFLRRRAPLATTGLLWFLVFLAPVAGLVPGGPAAFADRYAYLPGAGLCLAASGTAAHAARVWPLALRVTVAGAVLAMLATLSDAQRKVWRDPRSLYSRAVTVSPGSYVAHHDFGVLLVREGSREEGAAHFAEAVRLAPAFAPAHQGLAALHAGAGRLAEAERHYREALRLRPAMAGAQYELGAVLVAQGRSEEAIELYRDLVRRRPEFLEARNNLAVLLLAAGRREEAEAERAELLRLRAASRPAAR